MSTRQRRPLDEARQALARQECATYGHDIDFIHCGGSTEPVTAHCARGCGHHGWRMVPILGPPTDFFPTATSSDEEQR